MIAMVTSVPVVDETEKSVTTTALWGLTSKRAFYTGEVLYPTSLSFVKQFLLYKGRERLRVGCAWQEAGHSDNGIEC